jgi:hypothetical protein
MEAVALKVLEMVRPWPPLGQFIFFATVIAFAAGFVMSLARLAVALFRGWPPPGCGCGTAAVPEEWPDARRK